MPAAILTLILSITFAVAPYLWQPFMGYRDDQLPIPQPEPPVQPSGYAFAIWVVIYLWLIVSAVHGVWKRAGDPAWARVRLPLIGALALGTPWNEIAKADAIWATVVIFAMAACAITALLRSPAQDRWLLRAPVGLLAGWLTAASFAGLGVVAAGHGLGFGPVGWAWACILAALAVALVVQMRAPGAWGYGAAVVWALVAIAVRNGTQQWDVTLVALVGAVLVALVAARGALGGRAAA